MRHLSSYFLSWFIPMTQQMDCDLETRCYEDHNGIFVRLSSRNKLFARSHGPADQRHSRFAERDDHNRRQTTAATAPGIRRGDQGDSRGIEDLVATACGATKGCAERAAHHDRRPR